jgi:hypothetical protein
MYNNETSNQDIIWASWGWNTYFWSIFLVNRRLSVKPETKPFGF